MYNCLAKLLHIHSLQNIQTESGGSGSVSGIIYKEFNSAI